MQDRVLGLVAASAAFPEGRLGTVLGMGWFDGHPLLAAAPLRQRGHLCQGSGSEWGAPFALKTGRDTAAGLTTPAATVGLASGLPPGTLQAVGTREGRFVVGALLG